MYINVYKAKCDKVLLDNDSEYVVNIVPPPQLNWLHVPMKLGVGHGSEKEMEHDEVIFQIIHC